MRLKQMAERCPSSVFMGRGRLEGYRWQINERGVANIVKSDGDDVVEGLVYEIDANHKRQLDRNEGLTKGYYSDECLEIQFTPLEGGGVETAKELETARLRREESSQNELSENMALDDRQSTTHDDSALQQGEEAAPCTDSADHSASKYMKKCECLVYISKKHTADGDIRSEYIPRMEQAINDGRKFGLSPPFLDRLDKQIHPINPPPEASQHSRENQNESQDVQGTSQSGLDRSS